MSDRLERLSERAWRLVDRIVAGLLLVISQVDVLVNSKVQGPVPLNMAVFAVMALALLVRRSHPLVALSVVLAGAALLQALLTPPPDTFAAVVILVTAMYSTGRHLARRRALAALGLGAGTVIVLAAVYDSGDIAWPTIFFAFVPWLAGRTLRNQTALTRELAEKAERAAHAQHEEERRAVAAERSRIARELHDVLAHNLSVMVVQAGAARRVVDRSPERAAEAAELIQRTGREALAELRHLFGAVRRGEGEELSGPPTLARVDELAARARAAGLNLRLRIEGDPVALPTGVDLAAYRVVQEGLTNCLKHAPGSHAKLIVSYEPNEVVLWVEDDGAGRADGDGLAATGAGHGLAGMRERVELYGGILQAGLCESGGFAVRARLPTRPLVPGARLAGVVRAVTV